VVVALRTFACAAGLPVPDSSPRLSAYREQLACDLLDRHGLTASDAAFYPVARQGTAMLEVFTLMHQPTEAGRWTWLCSGGSQMGQVNEGTLSRADDHTGQRDHRHKGQLPANRRQHLRAPVLR
jgi:hypothetical protein